jgi:hypothetical protein
MRWNDCFRSLRLKLGSATEHGTLVRENDFCLVRIARSPLGYLSLYPGNVKTYMLHRHAAMNSLSST